jgi:hypothetical protein
MVRNALSSLALVFPFAAAFAQQQNDAPISTEGELPLYQDSLIYKPSSLRRLRKVVDSMSLKFKVCEYSRPYLSYHQTTGWDLVIQTEKRELFEAILKQVKAGEPPSAILPAIREQEPSESIWMNPKEIALVNKPSDGGFLPKSTGGRLSNEASPLPLQIYYTRPVRQWRYTTDETNSRYVIKGFYLDSAYSQSQIPDKYGKMVRFADCIIDSSKFFDSEVEIDPLNPGMTNPKTGKFYHDEDLYKLISSRIAAYIRKFRTPEMIRSLSVMRDSMKKSIDYSQDERMELSFRYYKLAREQGEYVIDSLARSLDKQSTFCQDLRRMAIEYPALFLNNPGWIQLMVAVCNDGSVVDRLSSVQLVGDCSADDGPRQAKHAIAVLAAEDGNWDVFIRAHLDILNDRFDRHSDGSYAWAGRGTYIRELEALGIDVPKLLIGSVLRVSNGSPKHYVSSVSRLGRAIVESKERERFLQLIREGISAEDLDPFNRVILQNLMLTYIYHLPSKLEHQLALTQYKAFAQPLPDYLKLDALAAKPRREE